MKRKENPAKIFLRRYKSISGRVDALNQAINQAMERAGNISVTLKEIKVLSSPSINDSMAEDVAAAVDACEILYQAKAEAEKALKEILTAIDSLTDERQKEILTRRYICGESFREIKEKIHYEDAQMFVLHGRALLAVNRWMNEHGYSA